MTADEDVFEPAPRRLNHPAMPVAAVFPECIAYFDQAALNARTTGTLRKTNGLRTARTNSALEKADRARDRNPFTLRESKLFFRGPVQLDRDALPTELYPRDGEQITTMKNLFQ
jgi:hypothetical protein